MGIVNCRQATQDGEEWTALWEEFFLLTLWRKKGWWWWWLWI